MVDVKDQISKAWEDFRNAAGNSLFDSVTGQIKQGFETSGVELKSIPEPEPKQNFLETSNPSINWMPYIAVTGVVLAGIFLMKKKSVRV